MFKFLNVGHSRKLKSFIRHVAKYQEQYESADLDQLRGVVISAKDRFENTKKRLPIDVLAKIFAVTSLASMKTLGKKHYNSQLMGGFVLSEAGIAEMQTGEGKTLVASLPAVSAFVRGRKMHIATTNEYLAGRDAEELRPLYESLGMTVATIKSGMEIPEKQSCYACDVVYGTVSEFGFDYLRDKLVVTPDDRMQEGLDCILVDEADSLLIDSGVTPLIMSGNSTRDASVFELIYPLITDFNYVNVKDMAHNAYDHNADVSFDLKGESITVLENGFAKLEQIFLDHGLLDQESMYQDQGIILFKAAEKCMSAHILKKRDSDYLVINGEVKIIDKNTGRVMESNRWSDGLHQAVEAKEGVEIKPETETTASIAIQNYIGLYSEFSGMTGTALSARKEFMDLYKTDVVAIPTNRPIQRIDQKDRFYESAYFKWNAIVNSIGIANAKGQPILIGTNSVEAADYLSTLLTESGFDHSLLSAKYHEREAEIIAQAGRPFAITIATSMAGRGTDIILGGNPKELVKMLNPESENYDADEQAIYDKCEKDREFVLNSGGLLVIGTERAESRRVDNQLRGRSGRQGDPGESQFYVSLEDTILRRFPSGLISRTWSAIGLAGTGDYVQSPSLDKAIAKIQETIEGMYSGSRKNTMEFDQVNQAIRNGFYSIREQWVDMSFEDVLDMVPDICIGAVDLLTDSLVNEYSDIIEKERVSVVNTVLYDWQLDITPQELDALLAESRNIDFINESLSNLLSIRTYNAIEQLGAENGAEVVRRTCLALLDSEWVILQSNLRELQSGSHLKSFAQKQPVREYHYEADALLKSTISEIEFIWPSTILKSIDEHVDYLNMLQFEAEHREALEAERKESHQRVFNIHPHYYEMMNLGYTFRNIEVSFI